MFLKVRRLCPVCKQCDREHVEVFSSTGFVDAIKYQERQ